MGALQSVDGRLDKINIPKFGGVFDVLDYVRQVDVASAEAIEAASVPGQDGNNVLAAVRAAGDDAMAFLQAKSNNGVLIQYPCGKIGLKDETFSDAFQAAYWLQTNLGKNKRLAIEGAGSEATVLEVRSDYISGVRNTLNGNQRSYGPWAGAPSPSFLIPLLASKNSRTPCFASVQRMTLRGTKVAGLDPVAIGEINALDAIHDELHIVNFANYGEMIMGSYNSKWDWVQHEGCGAQPVECGAIMGNPAGFPPPWIRFSIVNASGTLTITSKAGAALRGYAVGDVVPYFKSADVGKVINIYNGASHGGVPQVLRCVVASYVNANTITATRMDASVAIAGTIGTGTTNLSFMPVKATTTANSAVVNLSAPVKIGRGARDMIGQMVTIPKGGSKADGELDLFTARVASCDVGDDTDGYTQLTLTSQARDAATDDFIWSAAGSGARDEALLAAGSSWEMNDTDFHMCRWEHSAGYNEDAITSAYQLILQDVSGSAQLSSCKVHGAGPQQGAYCAEGNIIIDKTGHLDLVGCDLTFHVSNGKGQLRLMGSRQRIALIGLGGGAWQMPHDLSLVYLDPRTGYDAAGWTVIREGVFIRVKTFPFYSQKLFGGILGAAAMSRVFSNAQLQGGNVIRLVGGEDFNALVYDCDIYYDNPAGLLNAPEFSSYSYGRVRANPSSKVVTQTVIDANRHRVWRRELLAGTWSAWRTNEFVAVSTSTELADITSDINTKGKGAGKVVFASNTGNLYIAFGANANSQWALFNRNASTVTPS